MAGKEEVIENISQFTEDAIHIPFSFKASVEYTQIKGPVVKAKDIVNITIIEFCTIAVVSL